MKDIKYKKENLIHLGLAIAAVAFLAIGLWSGKRYYDETADLRQVESDMADMREELDFSRSEPVVAEDGTVYIEYNPYTPYFLGHDEFFCWITMPDTPINYPVAQAPEDDPYFFLTHEFTGRENRYGCLFVQSDQVGGGSPLADDIIYIFGHNNKNSTMFGDFVNFNDEDYFNDHFSFTLDFADVQREYEIFAVMDIGYGDSRFEYWDVFNFNPDRTEEDFLNQVIGMSYIKRYEGIDNLLGSEQYVVMITCEYTHAHGRRMVFARMINEIPYDPEVNADIIAREGR